MVVARPAGVIGVTGAEVEVGILIGDFELEGRLAGRVVREGAADVRAIKQRLATDFRFSQITREAIHVFKRKFYIIKRMQWHAQRSGQGSARLVKLAECVLRRQLSRFQRYTRLGHVKIGGRAGAELAFQQADDVALGDLLAHQQRFIFTGVVIIKQGGADLTACLPGGRNKIPARGIGKLFCLGDTFATFAGGFDGDVQVTGIIHGLGSAGNLGIITGGEGEGRIGTFGGGDFSGADGRPLRARTRARSGL